MTSVLLVSMLSQPRILLAMSRDGLLPPFFSAIHPRFKTPWKGTILTGCAVAAMASLIPLTILVEFVSIGTLVSEGHAQRLKLSAAELIADSLCVLLSLPQLAFTFVCISVLILRHTKPDLPRPFRCPFVPFVPVCGALLCLLLMFSLPATNWYRLLAWFGLGVVIYLLYGRKHGVGDKHRSERQEMSQQSGKRSAV